MILFFTSENCAWCDVVKNMLDEEMDHFGGVVSIYEVDIQRHEYITEAYGVNTVPTLVSKNNVISGVPTVGDLQSFLFQTATESGASSKSPKEIIWTDRPEQSTDIDTRTLFHN